MIIIITSKEYGKELPMAEYILSCCSTADLSREHLMSRSIPYVCFHF